MKSMESRSFQVQDSHQRMLDRQARREENQAKDRRQAEARVQRVMRESYQDRLARAQQRLQGANVPTTISLLESLSTKERDIYLIAEELGQNRKTVLRQFPAPRKTVREMFLDSPIEPQEGEEPQEEG